MEWLTEQVYLRITLADWLIALGATVGTVVALRFLTWLVQSRITRLAKKTTTKVDDVIAGVLQRTSWLFLLAVGLEVGLRVLMTDKRPVVKNGLADAETVINAVFVCALFFQVGLWAQRALRLSVENYRAEQSPGANERATMAAAFGFLGSFAIWSVVVLAALANLGVEIGALIAGLGVGGVAVALALQTVLGDLFASLSIYFDRPFDLGDFIIVGEFSGNVDKITLRSTRLRGLGGEQLVFSNADLSGSRIRNYKRMSERRIVFGVGIEYNLPAEKVRKAAELLKEAVDAVDGVRFDRAHFHAFGAHSLNYEVVYFVLMPDYAEYMNRQQEINFGIYDRFEAAGIPFAFPTQTVHMREAPERLVEAISSSLSPQPRA